jgi:hypothetical protein
LDVIYQSTPRELNQVSLYGAVQTDHHIPRSTLRPDLLLRRQRADSTRWIVIEAKGEPELSRSPHALPPTTYSRTEQRLHQSSTTPRPHTD